LFLIIKNFNLNLTFIYQEPINYWAKLYKRSDPNEYRDLWYFTQLQLRGTSNRLYLPDKMYDSVAQEDNFQIENLDQLNMYKLIPETKFYETISNWFIISSIQGLHLEYYYLATPDISGKKGTTKINFNFKFLLNNDLVSLYEAKIKWKLFILYNYDSCQTVGAYKLLTETNVDGPEINCEYTLSLKDLPKSIEQDDIKLNLPKSSELNKSLNCEGKITARVFSYAYLSLSGIDLAHAIADIGPLSVQNVVA